MRINLFKHSDGKRPRRSRPTMALITGITLAASATAVIGGASLAHASARPATAQTEHFQLVSTSATTSVIAYGAFTGSGVDVQGTTTDRVKFSDGTFEITHSPGTGPQNFDPSTCLFTLNQHGTYTIGHGTGKYVAIRGHGTYRISILGLGGRSNGKCSGPNTAPVAEQVVINASGPVRL